MDYDVYNKLMYVQLMMECFVDIVNLVKYLNNNNFVVMMMMLEYKDDLMLYHIFRIDIDHNVNDDYVLVILVMFVYVHLMVMNKFHLVLFHENHHHEILQYNFEIHHHIQAIYYDHYERIVEELDNRMDLVNDYNDHHIMVD